MKEYKIDAQVQKLVEQSVVPVGIYQYVEGRVVTLAVSVGLCQLLGYADQAKAMQSLDLDMYQNIHPDDVSRVAAAAAAFNLEDSPYNLVCRVRVDGVYRLIHTRGRHIDTSTGERLAVVWYIDEGSVTLDAATQGEEERIEALKASMQSLLNNMPALTFSKNVEDGKYLACNQMFAEYAHKKTPVDVVGLTDHEIFDAVTADHFVTDDKIALTMDVPYTFFEDTFDGAGNSRQFQTTKLKFIDETGRLCLLGMSMDVTEVTRVKREREQAKAAYEEAVSAGAIYENIVDALSQDYFNLFYVDLETEEYVEYGSRTEAGDRVFERHGGDFFAEARKNARDLIYEGDLERFTAALDREKLLRAIRKHGSFTLQYRLMIGDKPTYVSMKVTRIAGDDRHIIIGVSNVDTQVRDRMAAERAAEEEKLYQRMSALNSNLIVLYFVDPENGQYLEFSSSQGFKDLGLAQEGADFFRDARENGKKTIHPEDQVLYSAQVTRENILATIERDGVFLIDYRLMRGELPTYVRFKASMVDENGKKMLIVGLLNEDVQVRQEQEYARKLSVARSMAVVDSLTGVKNKHAYTQWEEKINAKIAKGEQPPFAVVVCDVNNLKAVNDLYGHKAGDSCIKEACAKICGIFSHSPVFRTGGDEFVVLLSGEDYARRADLMEQINYIPKDRSKAKIGETIAAGIVEFNKDRHSALLGVFEEADKAMYERKKYIKKCVFPEENQAERESEDEEIPVINVRKCVLIADDLEMNRELLVDLLGDEYRILTASDGVEALEILREHRDEVDLVLLDLYMPNMNGREVIAEMQVDEDLMAIPVIFLTVDEKAELDCLRIGAMDFIPKRFPDIEIVKARIDKCIELSEYRDLIRHTERDKLTGLLNRDYFFRYVDRLDHIYKEATMDAIVCDVDHFHAINKQFGRQFADQALRGIGVGIKKLARKLGGIGCRQGGDTFLFYCPHQDDYEGLLREFRSGLFTDKDMAQNVSLRFGIFADAQQLTDIEERFACANIAADRVKNDPRKLFRFYDEPV